MNKTSISVREMGNMLGLCKTESYWLVKKKVFEVREVAGTMRVMIESFEDWYAGQLHYKKLNGELPGSKLAESTLSIAEVAKRMNLCESWVYIVLKRENIKTTVIDNHLRVDRQYFEQWMASQTRYPFNHGEEEFADDEEGTVNNSEWD